MSTILNTLSKNILNIYVNNFPLFLRCSNKQFKKQTHKYYYYDLWVETDKSIITTPIGDVSLIGFSFLNFFPKLKLLHLDYISLDKKYQGKGQGSQYLNYIITKFYKSNKDIKYLVLECEDHLIKFYEKNGFVKIKQNYFYKGTKLNLMIYNDRLIMSSLLVNITNTLLQYFIKNLLEGYLTIRYYLIFYYFLITRMIQLKYHIIDNFK
jgi:ribosomal protein S18 acetylase RimI-like enzyme